MFPLLLQGSSVITGAVIITIITLACLGLYLLYKKTRGGHSHKDSDGGVGGGSLSQDDRQDSVKDPQSK